MRNICFFNSIKFWGGGEKLMLEFAEEFKKKGYSTFFISGKNSVLSEKIKNENIINYQINIGNLSFLNPFKIIKIIRFLKANKIDTLFFTTSQDLKAGSISAKLAKTSKIIYLRGLAVPIKGSKLNQYIFSKLLTHIIANSHETKKTILQNLKINPDKVKVIYHGIDPALKQNKMYVIPDIIAKNNTGIILGNVGRLTKQKGQHYLIEIAKKLKEKNVVFTLFIAGTGEMEEILKKLIQENGLHKEVILTGFVSDVDNFLQAIDIFLLTSAWEGFGFVLTEAMLQSKPVVAFNTSSNPEIVTNNKSGYLVNYPDIDDFAEKIKLLSENPDLRKSFGEFGYNDVQNRFILSDRINELEKYLIS